MIFTHFTERTNASGYFSACTLAGYYEHSSDGGNFYRYNTGVPSSNQGNFFFDAFFPSYFDIPTSWTEEYGDEKFSYELEVIGDYTAGGTNFTGCIRGVYTSGDGYYIISPGDGIVDLVFTRTDDSTARFEYQESQQFSVKHTLSGTVENSDGSAAENVEVQIGNMDFGVGDTTDVNGNFSVQVYGPDITLYVGYDQDSDGVLDFDEPNSEYTVSNITGDTNGITISLLP